MYNFHNLETANEKNLENLLFKNNNLRQLTFPFQLYFQTFHPDDENFFITTVVSPDFSIYFSQTREEMLPYLTNSLHHHDFYELLFILEGELYQNIENRRHLYTTGSCCLLNKKVQHTEEYSTDFRAVFVQLSDSFIHELHRNMSFNYFKIEQEQPLTPLKEFLTVNLNESENSTKNYIDFIPVQNNTWIIENVHNIFESITMGSLVPDIGSSSVIMELFCKLFRLLEDAANYMTTPMQIGTDSENRIYDRITEVMIQTNGRISRRELANTLHYSGVYLNNIVKKYTGLSIYDYGMTFCMKKTAELLASSDLSIYEIAAFMGFSNRTHFYKIFQGTYHMSPFEYRKKASISSPPSNSCYKNLEPDHDQNDPTEQRRLI